MVNISRLRGFVQDMTRLVERQGADEPAMLDAGERLLKDLIANDDWLPAEYALPSPESYRQYLLYCDPLERFSVSASDSVGHSLCFDDPLLIHFAAGDQRLRATTQHRIATWDFAGRPLPLRIERAGADRVCVDGITLPADHDGYTVVDIETVRPGIATNRVLVHIALDPASQQPRVIGLRRL